MKAIELTKGFVAVVDDEDFESLAQWRWHYTSGYAARMSPVPINGKRRKIWMHLEILKPIDGFEGDHINCDTLDNRRCNLRQATRMENVRNRRGSKEKKSKLPKGVYFYKKLQKFSSAIIANKERFYLGIFNTEQEAKAAYDKAAIFHHGGFANLN